MSTSPRPDVKVLIGNEEVELPPATRIVPVLVSDEYYDQVLDEGTLLSGCGAAAKFEALDDVVLDKSLQGRGLFTVTLTHGRSEPH